jgi:hypothetical protein
MGQNQGAKSTHGSYTAKSLGQRLSKLPVPHLLALKPSAMIIAATPNSALAFDSWVELVARYVCVHLPDARVIHRDSFATWSFGARVAYVDATSSRWVVRAGAKTTYPDAHDVRNAQMAGSDILAHFSAR